jgi:hypothetical protein
MRGVRSSSIFQYVGYPLAQADRTFRDDYTALQEKGTYLIYYRSSSRHETIPHTVQCLEIKLVVCFDRNEAHVLAIDRLSNRFGIEEVVLVRLDERLHKLSGNQSYIMALRS